MEQTKVFEAAEQFARVEGILPAPESSHAIRVAIDEALKCKETGEEKTIVFGLTGTGYFDMVAYEKFHNGEMTRLHPHRRGTGSQLRHAAQGARSGLKPPPTLTLSTHNRPAAPDFHAPPLPARGMQHP